MKSALLILLASSALAGCATMEKPMTSAPTVVEAPAPKAAPNPLTAEWTGPFQGVPAWDRLDVEQFPAAFTEAMADMKQEV
jgi:peptidyl-dipeptidase Dcp